jgi:proteasome lid subunit RPN8/RPN11
MIHIHRNNCEEIIRYSKAVMQRHSLREACGYLIGKKTVDSIFIEVVIPALNLGWPGSFWISDREENRIKEIAHNYNLELCALFHSHPKGSGELSPFDRKALNKSSLYWCIVAPPKTNSKTYQVRFYKPGVKRPLRYKVT